MDTPVARAPADAVRAAIARGYLNATHRSAIGVRRLGSIDLRPHQIEAVSRLHDILDTSQGALLADEVGLGKTYTALAVAAAAERALIVAPAVLVDMWRQASTTADVRGCSFVSHEMLSRGSAPFAQHDLVIIDEAHHARNPGTHRYAELAKLCVGARVLLLSATPIHNAEGDLRALFALFWGSRGWTCSLDDIGRAVVRRGKSVIESRMMPVAVAPRWLALPATDDLLEQIMALPPPLPPSDGGDGGALITYGLVRQWASSDAALTKAVIRRRARALALIAALEEGRYPTISELRAWACTDDTLQLAFPALLPPASTGTAALLDSVRAQEAALARLHARISASTDERRVEHLLALRQVHEGARIVAFTQFADTAYGLFRLIAPTGGVAMLTARGAVTVGGRLGRREVLTRFNDPSMRAADRIDLLVTTDILSEGVNLPEVSVVLHLDLPWTPARLEQRVGRALRMGSRHRQVHVYCMSPPASAQAMLRVEATLRRKLGDAARSVGISGAILPSLGGGSGKAQTVEQSPPQAEEEIRARLRRWLPPQPDSRATEMLWTCVTAPVDGWLGLIDNGSSWNLLSATGKDVSARPADVLKVVGYCEGPDNPDAPPDALERALIQVELWMRRRAGSRSAGLDAAPNVRAGIRLLQRINIIASRTPLHRRGRVIALAGTARQAVLNRRGIGSERLLHDLADSSLADEPWLEAVGAFTRAGPEATRTGIYRLRALLIFSAS